jgi:hypothetical protein
MFCKQQQRYQQLVQRDLLMSCGVHKHLDAAAAEEPASNRRKRDALWAPEMDGLLSVTLATSRQVKRSMPPLP